MARSTAVSSLPLFRKDPSCPKCGYPDVEIRWVGSTAQLDMSYLPRERRPLVAGEHLALACQTCQYRWACRPIDKANDLEKLADAEE